MAESRRRFLKQSVATVAAASVTACAPERGSRFASPRHPRPHPSLQPPCGPSPRPSCPPNSATTASNARSPPSYAGRTGSNRSPSWPTPTSCPKRATPARTRDRGGRPSSRASKRNPAARFGRDLADLDIPTRRTLLTRAVEQTGSGLGTPANANHVAIALMAHFFASPLATDLCYRRTIAKQQCRGLDGATAEPAALADAP